MDLDQVYTVLFKSRDVINIFISPVVFLSVRLYTIYALLLLLLLFEQNKNNKTKKRQTDKRNEKKKHEYKTIQNDTEPKNSQYGLCAVSASNVRVLSRPS